MHVHTRTHTQTNTHTKTHIYTQTQHTSAYGIQIRNFNSQTHISQKTGIMF